MMKIAPALRPPVSPPEARGRNPREPPRNVRSPRSPSSPRESAVSFRLSARTCLVAGLVCLQAADLICTYFLLDGAGGRGDVYEANPVARSILAQSGWLGVAAFKLG